MRIVHFAKSKNESYGVLINDNEILDIPILSKMRKTSTPSNIDELVSMNSSDERVYWTS